MTHWTDGLRTLRACDDAIAWAKTQPDLKTAWATCQRGDWMLWLAGRCIGKAGSAAHRRVVLAAVACARLSLPRFTAKHPGDKRPELALEAAEAWALRRGTSAASAADAAYAASSAAAYAAAAADADAARTSTLATCADLVRGIMPKPPRLERTHA